MHESGVHGGPSPRLVATVLPIGFRFGSAVLVAELVDDDPVGDHARAALTLTAAGFT